MTRPQKPKTLTAALERGIRAAGDDLTDRDMPTVMAARTYAATVDAVLEDPNTTPGERVKALHVLPHLVNACRMLGFNPIGRQEIEAVRARAAEIKARTKAPQGPRLKGSAALKAATGQANARATTPLRAVEDPTG